MKKTALLVVNLGLIAFGTIQSASADPRYIDPFAPAPSPSPVVTQPPVRQVVTPRPVAPRTAAPQTRVYAQPTPRPVTIAPTPAARPTYSPAPAQRAAQPIRPYQQPRPTPTPTPTPRMTSAPKASSGEEAVDLNALGPTTAGKDTDTHNNAASASSSQSSGGAPYGMAPNFKFLFDLWLINQPGAYDLTFRNIHSYTFVELMPDSKLTFQFSFNLSSMANFFELGYQVTPRLQVRGGKLLIPFDDTYPHTLYGGRPNLSAFFMSGQTAFLPDLWAEPGVAAKYRIADQSDFRLDGTIYVTNGFQGTTNDPYPNAPTQLYPDFSGNSGPAVNMTDNNRDKAVGLRFQSLWFRKLGVGASYYTCRWSDQSQSAERLSAYGMDAQLRLAASGTEFRAAAIDISVQLPYDTFSRGGWYFETSQAFGAKRLWKAVFRTGYRQNDTRVIEVADQRLVGGMIVYKPGLVQWSLETSRDLNNVPGKTNYSFTGLRAVVEL